jgi:hypothetical protein
MQDLRVLMNHGFKPQMNADIGRGLAATFSGAASGHGHGSSAVGKSARKRPAMA